MKIFLTGGAGYIGSAAAAALLESGHQVTVFDSLVTGHRAAVPDGADFIEADLGDHELVFEALKAQPYDAVMHFAAFAEAGESMREPGKYFENNAHHSLWLLEACVQAEVKRLVYSSSAAVYVTSDELLLEDARLGPSNPYGQTKLMVEGLLDWYRRVHGSGYAALRYFNAAGALADRGEAHAPGSHLIPLVLQVALGQRPEVRIFGGDYPTSDGTCIRDYIHLSDLVSAHLLALEHAEAGRAEIRLSHASGAVILEIVDDGHGFDLETARGHGYGLSNLRERAERLGGGLEIQTAPGQGTRLTLTIRANIMTGT